ncbi:M16 family metallopeptidase [Actinoplanes sp. CA-030573]|uniref:M16 family metallopeptidase n=1 Tax=Actinoplanes sp. CA-030573 TaxID=3239898 RepID=UPI003D8FB8DF
MIERLEVDGVPVLLAPTTGPTHAGLAFRVGLADEPMARRGITHLVEHLALHEVGITDYHYNGATGVEFTYFHMQGDEKDVIAFLNGVCASLRELPMRRLAVEKDLLQAEANGRNPGVAEPLALWRHGARDHGTVAYPEWGLPTITEDDLRAWVARYFTTENAVLWVAGDAVPADLRLDLPRGERRPAPEPSSALPVTPAFFPGGPGVLAWDTIVPRSTTAAVFCGLLERVMFRELRQEAGLSYTIKTDYRPIAGDRVVITAVADALPEKQGAVLGAFVDLLATLRVGRIDEADVTAVVNQRVETLRRREETGARLPVQAMALLGGREVRDVEDVVAESKAVTVAEVAELAARAWSAGLLMTPCDAEWAGFAVAPRESESAVSGTAYRSLADPDEKLVVGPDGISAFADGTIATVRFDDCVLVRAWPDGARQLFGADGIVIRVEPTLNAKGARAVADIDARVRPELRVDQPARDPAQIPKPQPRGKATKTKATKTKAARRRITGPAPAQLLRSVIRALRRS